MLRLGIEGRQMELFNTQNNNYKGCYGVDISCQEWLEGWDFMGYRTDIYTHGFHKYPAVFIPQLVRKLIVTFSNERDCVCDMFCGSGTTLVESRLLNRDSIGIELNPLAVLITRVKTTLIDPQVLYNKLETIIKEYENVCNIDVPRFHSINFWFGEKVIEELVRIRYTIQNIYEEDVRSFFLLVFSEVVRIVSFTKHNEFKLSRSTDKLSGVFCPDVLGSFIKICKKNIVGMSDYVRDVVKETTTQIIMGDSTKDNGIQDNSVDLIVTSPPYGDSRTTVAYGQFSKLSLRWLGLFPENIKDIDKELLGGRSSVDIDDSIVKQSNTLKYSIGSIVEKDEKRAKEVISFYSDLEKVLRQTYKILKPQKYMCLVVGNRTVKGVLLKTDMIICELGEKIGFTVQGVLYRNIVNKRLPLRNSPTNESGETGSTILKESIVLLKKTK